MAIIQLSRGYECQVDDQDYEALQQFQWTADVHTATPEYELVYAARWLWLGVGEPRPKIYMHRAIVNPPPDFTVDHWNGNGIDNRRKNLRLATWSQNRNNHNNWRFGTNRYRGVTRDKGGWRVRVTRVREDGSREYLYTANFHDEVEAALNYDTAVLRLFGEFAQTNFRQPDRTPKRVVPPDDLPF